ncbi:MAG TPA: hypothetical protein VEC06_14430 [Paucimonas sp.]|nr:hypothetical protein [Paucimonas sp.]
MTPIKLFQAALAACLVFMLAACGGQGNGAGTPTSNSIAPKLLPTFYTSEGRPLNSCSLTPECSGVATAPFHARIAAAPAGGAAVSGVVRLEVQGNELRNVELLPASGYAPRLGVFNITGDRTFAWLDLDTRVLGNGAPTVRVSAFNAPAGQAGATEIVAMPARTWNVANPPPPTGGFVATVGTAPANNATVKGIVRLEVRGNRMANVELLPAAGYAPRLGVFNVAADGAFAWLDFDTRSLPDGIRDVRISAFSVLPGQPNAAEAVAMPARRWDFRNGASSAFTATAAIAPPHGAIVNGVIRLELRGSGIQNAELLPAVGYAPRLGVFNIAADRTFAWLDLDTAGLPNGALDARISAFSVAPGQPNAKEIVAMPARQWVVRH